MHFAVLMLCTAALAAPLLFHFSETMLCILGFKWPLRCLLHQTFGVKCALCGLTRSFCALVHGDLPAALTFHPLGPVIYAFICLQIPYRIGAIIIHPNKLNGILIKVNLLSAAAVPTAILANWLIYLGGLVV